MKGTIVQCLRELVEAKYGKERWASIMEASGLRASTIFLATQDVDDAMVMTVLGNTCSTLGITLEQAADAFGNYWVTTYAPRIYRSTYSRFRDARSFLLGMDEVHVQATMTTENARPPRFEYHWKDDSTVLVTYKSHRQLIDILVGLIKGLGAHFKEPLVVKKLSDTQVEVTFL